MELDYPDNHAGALDNINRTLIKDNLQVQYEQGQYIFVSTVKPRISVKPTDLISALGDFARYISSDMRMSLWQFDKITNKYNWISRPEQHTKNLLLTFLNGRFGESVYTFEEIKAGAGKIDIYIALPKGEKIIVELKMSGHGYSETYALDGLEQLAHYMKNKDTNMSYLIIFESRVRDFAKDFPETENVGGKPIIIGVADVRPYVKLKNAPNDV